MAKSEGSSYFNSYCDLSVHELMLKDRPRTLAYRKFIEENRDLIKGKVVMDIGAGTGILSLFAAAAGAKKVYAVEASKTATLCQEIVSENNYDQVIEVIHGAVENIHLPYDVKVDVMISEWMGFYLLHESMLDSVIHARDTFLAPDGVMVPARASIYLAPVDMTDRFQERADVWSNMYGFDFSPIASAMNMKEVSEPLIEMLSGDILRSEPQEIVKFDLKTVTLDQVQRISKCCKFTINQESMVHGFAAWFKVDFGSPEAFAESNGNSSSLSNDSKTSDVTAQGDAASSSINSEPKKKKGVRFDTPKPQLVSLCTGPSDPPTHWKQTVIFLPQTCLMEQGIDVWCNIKMAQDKDNKRHYNITLELTDGEALDNGIDIDEDEGSEDESDDSEASDMSADCPVPCHCGSERCRLIAALVEKYDTEHEMLGEEAEMVELQAEVDAAKQLDSEIEQDKELDCEPEEG